MENEITTNDLIHFIQGKLPPMRKQQVKQFLLENPHYYRVIHGLYQLQKETADVAEHLEAMKKKMRDGLFNNKKP